MRTTLHARIEASHLLRDGLRELIEKGEKRGPCRYQSIIDSVELVDELLDGRSAPDEAAVAALMKNTIERIHDAVLSPNTEIAEREPFVILWDFLREVNKLTSRVKS